MVWALKSKNAAPTTTLKTKTLQSGDESYITTPDGHIIFVGASEDQALIYSPAFDNWVLKAK